MTNVGRDYMATMEKYDFTRPAVDDPNRMVDDVNRRDVRAFPEHELVGPELLTWHLRV